MNISSTNNNNKIIKFINCEYKQYDSDVIMTCEIDYTGVEIEDIERIKNIE